MAGDTLGVSCLAGMRKVARALCERAAVTIVVPVPGQLPS
ncbi:hypothetical protein FB570_11782 [Streptomyces sp. T12]|nr:hypothetical protein FB570_11782 [Streptomyces sp. T12]